MEITKKELLDHCASATKELTEEMPGLEGHGRIALILTVVAFTSILSNRIFPDEKKRRIKNERVNFKNATN